MSPGGEPHTGKAYPLIIDAPPILALLAGEVAYLFAAIPGYFQNSQGHVTVVT